jgi:DNA phosphorothioation-associated putative methyltransferase
VLGRELLFSAGNAVQIQQACESNALGWQDGQALYVHSSLLKKLSPVLQVYVGCAALLGGDVNDVDLVKLHKASGKVTFLIYDDFQTETMPELRQRIKINLRTLSVQVFDHSNSGQLLFFKDEFLLPEDPLAEQAASISAILRKLGVTVQDSFGPGRPDILLTLETLGIRKQTRRDGTRTDANADEIARQPSDARS